MIPRTVHFAGYRSYADSQIPNLKPGQDLNCKYYQAVARPEVNAPALDNHNRFKTVYNDSLVETITPEDYSNTRSVVFDRIGKPLGLQPDPVPPKPSANPTSHWRSENQAALSRKDDLASRSERPEWSKHVAPHSVRMPQGHYDTRKL